MKFFNFYLLFMFIFIQTGNYRFFLREDNLKVEIITAIMEFYGVYNEK